MKLSTIIPTKDRREIFSKTLQCAISALSHLDAEIIVVNDSKTETPAMPAGHAIKLINNEKSGVAAARNLGFRHAQGDLILFLDNDILISKESVDHIIQLHTDYPNACINLNWEYSPDTLLKMEQLSFNRFLKSAGMTSFKGWYNDASWRDNDLFISKSIASFHLSISRPNFEKSGGYNEQFTFAGFEDYDFPLKLKALGVDFYIDTRVTVYHNEIDRLDLNNWLDNQERRAVTRKKAVSIGHAELALEYHFFKRILLDLIIRYESALKAGLVRLPNRSITDPFYFKMVSALQASRIYRGYTSS